VARFTMSRGPMHMVARPGWGSGSSPGPGGDSYVLVVASGEDGALNMLDDNKAKTTSSTRLTTLPKAKFGRGLPTARRDEVKQLQEIEKKGYASRRRFWEREYLQAVYEIYCDWRADNGTTRRAKQMAQVCKRTPRKASHPIRIIIDCSSPNTDEKMRSRWTLALRHANAKGISSSKLLEFLDEEGGIAGRASEFRARQRKAAAAKKQAVKK
jgi:hypothetical protein